LQASHIVDWSTDEANRTNPENGLCLNVLFHKAYDEHLLGITPDYEIIVAKDFFLSKPQNVEESTVNFIMEFDHKKIITPKRFFPDRELLAEHYEQFKRTAI
jgi:putative restriction endonuclease